MRISRIDGQRGLVSGIRRAVRFIVPVAVAVVGRCRCRVLANLLAHGVESSSSSSAFVRSFVGVRFRLWEISGLDTVAWWADGSCKRDISTRCAGIRRDGMGRSFWCGGDELLV